MMTGSGGTQPATRRSVHPSPSESNSDDNGLHGPTPALEASIRTREYTQLMARGKKLEAEVAKRGQGGQEGRDRPEGLTHRL
jgi:hypothetical protein